MKGMLKTIALTRILTYKLFTDLQISWQLQIKYYFLTFGMLIICQQCQFVMLCAIWHHLRNLKNMKNAHGGVLVKLQTRNNPPPWVSSHFLNCTNGTKMWKAVHLLVPNFFPSLKVSHGIIYSVYPLIPTSDCVPERDEGGTREGWGAGRGGGEKCWFCRNFYLCTTKWLIPTPAPESPPPTPTPNVCASAPMH